MLSNYASYIYRIVDCLPKLFYMKVALPAYSEAIGEILKVFLSRVMRCKKENHVPGLGTRAGSTLLLSTTARFCDIKQRQNCSFLTSSSIAITSLTIRSS